MNDESSLNLRENELIPSSFAIYVRRLLSEHDRNVIVPGCGNGADALYFAGENLNVLAISSVEEDIQYLNQHHKQLRNIRFLYADHTQMLNETIFYDLVYSRNILNSISEEDEKQLIRWSYRHLRNGGLLCIEAKGKIVQTAPKNSSLLPRAIDFNTLCNKLTIMDFQLNFAKEEKRYLHHRIEEETSFRIIASKK